MANEPIIKGLAKEALKTDIGQGLLQKAEDWLDDLGTVTEFVAEKMPSQEMFPKVESTPEREMKLARVGMSVDEFNQMIGQAEEAAMNFGPQAMAGTISTKAGKALKDIYRTVKPIDAYHGTTSAFTEFKPGMTGKTTGAASAKEGFWFVDTPKVAESYATYSAETWPVKKLLEEADQYERIAQKTSYNPEKWWAKYDDAVRRAEELEAQIKQDNFRGQNVIPAKLYMRNPKVMDAKGATYFETEENITDFIRQAKKEGHDGVVIKNLDDAATFANMPATHYVVFDKAQIKGKYNKSPTADPNFMKSIVGGVGLGGAALAAEEFLDQ